MGKLQQFTDRHCALPSRTYQEPEHRRHIWIWMERIVLALGLMLLGIYGAALFESVLDSRAFLRRFTSLNPSTDLPVRDGKEGNQPGVDSVSAEALALGLPKEPAAPLAVLEIPKIHLVTPVLDGTDDLTLNHAVGRIAGTAWPGQPGNIGIAGHRDSFFRGLKDIKVGDLIDLETRRGIDTYTVDQIQIVTPDAVSVLRPRPVPSLTLVTCYPFYFIGSAPKRFIVKASLTQQTEAGANTFAARSTVTNTQFNKEKK